MKLEGIHHITAITGDGAAQRRLLRRRPRPAAGEEDRQPGPADRLPPLLRRRGGQPRRRHHLLRVPAAPTAGRAGAGMVHRIVWRVGSPEALDFWAEAAAREHGIEASATATACASPTPRASSTSSRSSTSTDPPLIADHPEVPAEHALQGFHAARAYTSDPERSARPARRGARVRAAPDAEWEARGDERGGLWAYDDAAGPRRLQGAGTVHHIAWASEMDDHERLARAGRSRPALRPTPVIDRFWFSSIYFREPSGVLFEIATLGPGLRRRRGPRAPRREARPAAGLRAPARADRGRADPDPNPRAGRGEARVSRTAARAPDPRAGGRARGRARAQPRARRRASTTSSR